VRFQREASYHGELARNKSRLVLVLYRKREQARRVHEHGVFARFRYNDLH
jgi:hypothetical protein